MKYYHQTIVNNTILLQFGITEERIIKDQIIALIKEIPLEDLVKVFEVRKEKVVDYFLTNLENGDEEKVTVSIDIE
jgi:Mg/Co/Ni transporter MgtE